MSDPEKSCSDLATSLHEKTVQLDKHLRNLTTINEEYQDEDLKFTLAVLMYMLKELHDVFGNQDAFKSEIEKLVENKLEFEAEKLEAAI